MSLASQLHSPGAEVLEVSCGEGRILSELRARGYHVTGTNFGTYENAPRDFPIHNGVNLLERVPFEDACFDEVLAVEVIEHVENHRKAVAEIARLLRPGGHAILTFPNVLRLSSRLNFLLTGTHKPKRKFIGFDVPVDKSYAFHLYPPELPTLAYLLEAHGLSIETVQPFHIKLKSILLYALGCVPCAVATAARLFCKEKHLKRSGQSGRLWRYLMSPAVLCSENLIVVAAKCDLPLHARSDRATRLPRWAGDVTPNRGVTR